MSSDWLEFGFEPKCAKSYAVDPQNPSEWALPNYGVLMLAYSNMETSSKEDQRSPVTIYEPQRGAKEKHLINEYQMATRIRPHATIPTLYFWDSISADRRFYFEPIRPSKACFFELLGQRDDNFNLISAPLMTNLERNMALIGISCGLMNLHEQQIAHRNFTSKVIFFTTDSKPKIFGFQHARDPTAFEEMRENVTCLAKSRTEDPDCIEYTDPLTLLEHDPNTTDLGFNCDIYAYGIFVLSLMTQSRPILLAGHKKLCTDNSKHHFQFKTMLKDHEGTWFMGEKPHHLLCEIIAHATDHRDLARSSMSTYVQWLFHHFQTKGRPIFPLTDPADLETLKTYMSECLHNLIIPPRFQRYITLTISDEEREAREATQKLIEKVGLSPRNDELTANHTQINDVMMLGRRFAKGIGTIVSYTDMYKCYRYAGKAGYLMGYLNLASYIMDKMDPHPDEIKTAITCLKKVANSFLEPDGTKRTPLTKDEAKKARYPYHWDPTNYQCMIYARIKIAHILIEQNADFYKKYFKIDAINKYEKCHCEAIQWLKPYAEGQFANPDVTFMYADIVLQFQAKTNLKALNYSFRTFVYLLQSFSMEKCFAKIAEIYMIFDGHQPRIPALLTHESALKSAAAQWLLAKYYIQYEPQKSGLIRAAIDRAVELNSSHAMTAKAKYMMAQQYGYKRDMAKAIELLQDAADEIVGVNGRKIIMRNPEANYQLGMLIMTSDLVERNPLLAQEYLLRAKRFSSIPHSPAYFKALLALARLASLGDGTAILEDKLGANEYFREFRINMREELVDDDVINEYNELQNAYTDYFTLSIAVIDQNNTPTHIASVPDYAYQQATIPAMGPTPHSVGDLRQPPS